MREIGFRVKA